MLRFQGFLGSLKLFQNYPIHYRLIVMHAITHKAGHWRACITFFDLALIHDSLENHYRLTMKLALDFKMPISEVEDMMPFEREVYVALINEKIEREKDAAT